MAQATAQLNRLRIAPRKVRTLAKVLKGMDLDKARFQLSYLVKRSGNPLKKLLNSAVANAINNFSMVENNLLIKNIVVNEGMKLKRFRPKGFGRAALIQKKTSNIKIILEEKTPGLRAEKKEMHKKAEVQKEMHTIDKTDKKPEVKKEIGKKKVLGEVKNIGRRIFSRKSI